MPETPIVERALPPQSLILFHGLGSDGDDMRGLAQSLSWSGRLLCPDAAPRPVTLNAGFVMRAWFDILGLTPDAPVDEAGIRQAVAQARQLIEAERAAGVPAERIFIGGFSQGGVVALHAALRHPERLGGVLALSTWLPLRHVLAAEHQPAALATPIFMGHGTRDDMVPLASAERARDALRELGCRDLVFRTYPMAHSVGGEELADLRAWLAHHLG
ncbi:alpha/beta hydrolase-fold protein [Thiofaba sp. EF100]|uniref:alpha/beta hydrolase n=1 Tax=Thiofaba sp. EF100 TaxID=3121274 RepID=UPI00322199ED